jgi:hypothetical protein
MLHYSTVCEFCLLFFDHAAKGTWTLTSRVIAPTGSQPIEDKPALLVHDSTEYRIMVSGIPCI